MMDVEVWDKDEVTNNDCIGAGTVALGPVFSKNKVEEWVPLHYAV